MNHYALVHSIGTISHYRNSSLRYQFVVFLFLDTHPARVWCIYFVLFILDCLSAFRIMAVPVQANENTYNSRVCVCACQDLSESLAWLFSPLLGALILCERYIAIAKCGKFHLIAMQGTKLMSFNPRLAYTLLPSRHSNWAKSFGV